MKKIKKLNKTIDKLIKKCYNKLSKEIKKKKKGIDDYDKENDKERKF